MLFILSLNQPKASHSYSVGPSLILQFFCILSPGISGKNNIPYLILPIPKLLVFKYLNIIPYILLKSIDSFCTSMKPLLLCFLYLLYLSFAEVLLVPIIEGVLELKSNEVLTNTVFSGIEVDNVRIKQIANQKSKYSTLCRIRPAYLETNMNSLVIFQEKSNKSRIISELSQLKTLKNAIDLAEFKGYYYVIFKQGTVDVYNIQESNILEKIKTIVNGQPLSEGYFTSNKDTLLYVSPTEFFQVNSTNLLAKTDYDPIFDMAYVRLFDDGHLFVSLDHDGIYYQHFDHIAFQLTNKTYLDLAELTGKFFQIQDFSFDVTLNLLIVSDYLNGVYFFNFDPKSLNFSLNSKHFINKTKCQNMAYSKKTVYLTCPELIKYSLQTYELQIKPSTIYSEDLIVTENNSILLVGGSHIAYYKRWQSNPVLEEVMEPSKLIFGTDKLVYINDYELLQQSFQLKPDQMICAAQHHQAGVYTMLIEGEGACNRNYLSNHNIELQFTEEDTCNYEGRLMIQIWQPHNIKWVFISIGFIGLLILVFLFFSWCCFKSLKINKQYQDLVQVQASQNQMQVRVQPPPNSIDLDPTGRQIAAQASRS